MTEDTFMGGLRRAYARLACMCLRLGTQYCRAHDAQFDPATGEWLDPRCSNPACDFCGRRPARHPEGCADDDPPEGLLL